MYYIVLSGYYKSYSKKLRNKNMIYNIQNQYAALKSNVVFKFLFE